MPRPAATWSEMNGSCATTFMPNARARSATSWPIRPSPTSAERLAAQLRAHQRLLVPHRPLHRGVGGGNGARERQHQRKRVLGDAHAVGARRVHHEDAARGGGGEIDVVDARTGAGDHPKLRRRVNQRGVHFRGASYDQRIGVGQIAREHVRRASGSRVNGPTRHTSEDLDGGSGQLVSDHDVHGRSYIMCRCAVGKKRFLRTIVVQTAGSRGMTRVRCTGRGCFPHTFPQVL